METLHTSRLTIRPFTMDDLEEAHRLLDQDIQWAGPGRDIAFRGGKLELYTSLANWEDTVGLYGYRALILNATGEMIGICGFHPDLWTMEWKMIFWQQLFGAVDEDDLGFTSLELGIGYAISSRKRGKGYASEAVSAFLEYAFDEIKIKRVFAITDRFNKGSINLMKRVGMLLAENPDKSAVYPAFVGMIENSIG